MVHAGLFSCIKKGPVFFAIFFFCFMIEKELPLRKSTFFAYVTSQKQNKI